VWAQLLEIGDELI